MPVRNIFTHIVHPAEFNISFSWPFRITSTLSKSSLAWIAIPWRQRGLTQLHSFCFLEDSFPLITSRNRIKWEFLKIRSKSNQPSHFPFKDKCAVKHAQSCSHEKCMLALSWSSCVTHSALHKIYIYFYIGLFSYIKYDYWHASVCCTTYCNVHEHFTMTNKDFCISLWSILWCRLVKGLGCD